jgi:hypothetical protein
MPIKKRKYLDLSGQRFGKLLVERYVGNNNHAGAVFECKCDCGVKIILTGMMLRHFRKDNCGCVDWRINRKRKRAKRYNAKGYFVTKEGIKYLSCPLHPRSRSGFVKESILIAEKALGKYLPKGAIVHHMNGDPSDNTPSNLAVLQNVAHHNIIHKKTRMLQLRRKVA